MMKYGEIVITLVSQAILLGVAVFAVQRMISGALASFKSHCRLVSSAICTDIGELKKADDELWKAINRHGHKALDSNGSKVTR